MPVVNPIPKEKAADAAKPIYDDLTKRFGRAPNIFAVMAHRPAALKNFLAFYASVMSEGGRAEVQRAGVPEDLDPERVRVLNPRPHRFGEADRHHRRADQGADVLRDEPALRREGEGGAPLRRAADAGRGCRAPRRGARRVQATP